MGEAALFPIWVGPLYSVVEHPRLVTIDWWVMIFRRPSPRQGLMVSPSVAEAGRLNVLHTVREALELERK